MVGNDADYFLLHRLPLALKLLEFGYDLHVAIPYEPTDVRFHDRPFPVHRIFLERGGVKPHEELRTLVQLVHLYSRLRPQLVHHFTIKPTLYGGLAARLAGVPNVVSAMTGLGYVFSSNTALARVIRALARWPLRLACRRKNVSMIFQNAQDLETFVSLGFSYRESAVLIKGCGVDPNVFYPVSSAAPVTEPIVMLVSRMLWDKGIAEFVQAARSLKAAGVRARFVLVGGTDPNPSSVPEAVLQQWCRDGVVEWWGQRSDMPDVWRAAHIACLPSYAEGLSQSLLEAAASGLPLVASDIPGCREIVREGQTGFLVAKGDAGQLAAALQRLIEAPSLRAQLGKNARAVAMAEFTVDSVAAQTVAVYESLLGRHGAVSESPALPDVADHGQR